MRTDITISALVAGTLLFALCFIGMMTKAGSFVLLISHFLPGLILAILLVQHLTYEVSARTRILFVTFSSAIYIACVFFVNFAQDDEVWTSIKMIMSSAVGALLLSAAYDLLLFGRVGFVRTFLFPFLLGALASLPSAFCQYYLHYVDFEQKVLETLIWAGIFSIFPIWYYLFTLNIKTRELAAANRLNT